MTLIRSLLRSAAALARTVPGSAAGLFRSAVAIASDFVAVATVPMYRRKLWADSRALAAQTYSLMMLIGLGILLFVGLFQAYQHLTVTYTSIYDTARFADCTILVDRAPEGLVEQVRTIPHVRNAIGRAVKDGSIIQRGKERERVTGRFIGLPRNRRPEINDVWMTEGRYIANADEAVLEHQFAVETGYHIGDTIKCSYVGREREFVLVGFAVSPEYVYPVPSKHALFVARGTFGVVFIDEDRAREWLGTGRQITEVHAIVDDGYEHEVLEKMEGLGNRYGLGTSYVQDDQPSKALLTMDQKGFAVMSVFFPILFLGSAGLSLYGALTRIVRLQVTVIGTLRACGFGPGQILVQHILQGLLTSLAGAIPGVILGHWMSVGLGALYASTLKLPMFITQPHWTTIVTGLALAALTGLFAAYLPAKMASQLPPAVAMRGDVESPASLQTQRRLTDLIRLDRVVHLIPLRGIFRRASRTLLAMAGIAGGASIIITTFGMYNSTMDSIDEFFTGTRKYELDVQFLTPDGMNLAGAVSALPGSRAYTRTTSLPVRVSSPWGSGELILTGLERGQQLLRVRTLTGRGAPVEAGEVWLPKQLTHRLKVEPGDPVRVEWVNSSRRRTISKVMHVSGVLDVSIGNSAYGEFSDIRRSFTDRVYPEASYGAYIDCERSRTPALKSRLERSDFVASVATTADIEEQMDEQMKMTFIFIGVLLIFGSLLAGSAIHSVASVSILERTRELATLRSLGFTARTTAGLVAVELASLAALGLIVGVPMGVKLNALFMGSYNTENMTFRPVMPGWVLVVTVLMVYALVAFSSWQAARRLASLDLSQATKAGE